MVFSTLFVAFVGHAVKTTPMSDFEDDLDGVFDAFFDCPSTQITYCALCNQDVLTGSTSPIILQCGCTAHFACKQNLMTDPAEPERRCFGCFAQLFYFPDPPNRANSFQSPVNKSNGPNSKIGNAPYNTIDDFNENLSCDAAVTPSTLTQSPCVVSNTPSEKSKIRYKTTIYKFIDLGAKSTLTKYVESSAPIFPAIPPPPPPIPPLWIERAVQAEADAVQKAIEVHDNLIRAIDVRLTTLSACFNFSLF